MLACNKITIKIAPPYNYIDLDTRFDCFFYFGLNFRTFRTQSGSGRVDESNVIFLCRANKKFIIPYLETKAV